jgi:CubicO group peptidase (beta-lactamase class C family)
MPSIFQDISFIWILFCDMLSPPAQMHDGSLSHIQHIENSLIPISCSGLDSGSRQNIQDRLKAWSVPGISVAFLDSGRIVWAKGCGLRDKANDLVVDTATLFSRPHPSQNP